MRHWKVKLLCEGYASATDDQNKIRRAYVRWLVEAEDGHAAMEQARELAECDPCLPMDVRWKSFEPIEAVAVGIPISINELANF